MPDPYENENCDGCRYFLDVDFCANKKANRDEWPDLANRCDLFEPSQVCRQTMAAERTADALEKLADLAGCLRDDGHGGFIFEMTK